MSLSGELRRWRGRLGGQLAAPEVEAAGQAIAALIGSQGLGMSVTATQQQGGVTRALSGPRRVGISPARLTHLTGAHLTGAPSDVLAGL